MCWISSIHGKGRERPNVFTFCASPLHFNRSSEKALRAVEALIQCPLQLSALFWEVFI